MLEVRGKLFEKGGSGGGIPEAPIDGKTYGRKDAKWVEIIAEEGSDHYVKEIPKDADKGIYILYAEGDGKATTKERERGDKVYYKLNKDIPHATVEIKAENGWYDVTMTEDNGVSKQMWKMSETIDTAKCPCEENGQVLIQLECEAVHGWMYQDCLYLVDGDLYAEDKSTLLYDSKLNLWNKDLFAEPPQIYVRQSPYAWNEEFKAWLKASAKKIEGEETETITAKFPIAMFLTELLSEATYGEIIIPAGPEDAEYYANGLSEDGFEGIIMPMSMTEVPNDYWFKINPDMPLQNTKKESKTKKAQNLLYAGIQKKREEIGNVGVDLETNSLIIEGNGLNFNEGDELADLMINVLAEQIFVECEQKDAILHLTSYLINEDRPNEKICLTVCGRQDFVKACIVRDGKEIDVSKAVATYLDENSDRPVSAAAVADFVESELENAYEYTRQEVQGEAEQRRVSEEEIRRDFDEKIDFIELPGGSGTLDDKIFEELLANPHKLIKHVNKYYRYSGHINTGAGTKHIYVSTMYVTSQNAFRIEYLRIQNADKYYQFNGSDFPLTQMKSDIDSLKDNKQDKFIEIEFSTSPYAPIDEESMVLILADPERVRLRNTSNGYIYRYLYDTATQLTYSVSKPMMEGNNTYKNYSITITKETGGFSFSAGRFYTEEGVDKLLANKLPIVEHEETVNADDIMDEGVHYGVINLRDDEAAALLCIHRGDWMYQLAFTHNQHLWYRHGVAGGWATWDVLANMSDPRKGMHYEVVDELPETGDDLVIYLMLKEQQENATVKDDYDMYIWVDGVYQRIGHTQIDLSGFLKSAVAEQTYLKKTDAENTYAKKTDIDLKLTASQSTTIDGKTVPKLKKSELFNTIFRGAMTGKKYTIALNTGENDLMFYVTDIQFSGSYTITISGNGGEHYIYNFSTGGSDDYVTPTRKIKSLVVQGKYDTFTDSTGEHGFIRVNSEDVLLVRDLFKAGADITVLGDDSHLSHHSKVVGVTIGASNEIFIYLVQGHSILGIEYDSSGAYAGIGGLRKLEIPSIS